MRVMVCRALFETGVQGLHVEEAENGSDALAKLALQRPDLILSDWSMPEMTGIELLRELRARGCDVRFGFITCETASEQMRETAFQAGAQFMLAKPLDVRHFRELLGS
jgi:two-component system chemotaxis response regulator CheY